MPSLNSYSPLNGVDATTRTDAVLAGDQPAILGLPAEILQEILGWTKDDKTLCALLLVSRQVSQNAAPVLYRSATLHQRNIASFASAIDKRLDLGRAVRSLSVSSRFEGQPIPPADTALCRRLSGRDGTSSGDFFDDAGDGFMGAMLAAVLQRTPGLVALRSPYDAAPGLLLACPLELRRLRVLEAPVDECERLRWWDGAALLRAAPGLQRLVFHSPEALAAPARVSVEAWPVSLTEVVLHSPGNLHADVLLAVLARCVALKSFSCSGCFRTEQRAGRHVSLMPALRRHRATLQTLGLWCDMLTADGQVYDLVASLHDFAQLADVRIAINHFLPRPVSEDAAGSPGLLRSLAASLRRLCIVSMTHDTIIYPFRGFCDDVAAGKYPRLRVVVLEVPYTMLAFTVQFAEMETRCQELGLEFYFKLGSFRHRPFDWDDVSELCWTQPALPKPMELEW